MVEEYLARDWSIIPIQPRGKRPVGEWREYQTTRASAQQVEAWADEEYNLAVVTGEVSGIVVVDCDSDAGRVAANRLGLPLTPTATTGNGSHHFYRHPGQEVRNGARVCEDTDIRGDGGYVLVAPSVHPNGQSYRWVDGLGLDDVPLAECPAWVLEGVSRPEGGRSPSEWFDAFGDTVGKGQRNQRCAELAGYLLRKGLDSDVTALLLSYWNRGACSPPMPDAEVSRTVDSINELEQRRLRP